MEIAQTPSPAFSGSAPAAEDKAPPAISSDFETFLRMLTVQMQNQDPLNPIDSADYAVQLATFSGVEQQVQTNQLLENLATQLGGSDLSRAAGWIGLEARTDAAVRFDGVPVFLRLDPDPGAARAALVVRNAAGDEVQRLPIDPASSEVEWAGVDAAGTALPAGSYAFAVENKAGGEVISTRPAQGFARIVEVRGDGGSTVVVLDSGAEIAPEDMHAVRAPQ